MSACLQQGEWKQKTIPNPDYFKEDSPLSHVDPIGGVAIEIWTTDDGYIFDSIMVAQDEAPAEQYRADVWVKRHEAEVWLV